MGQAYCVETSTNLLTWSPLTNFVSTLATTELQRITPTNGNQRFFRAVLE